MRTTLRSLLAFHDQQPMSDSNRDNVAVALQEDANVTGLLERIKGLAPQPRMAAPNVQVAGTLDPNYVAQYIDNSLAAELCPQFERSCLKSDAALAEVAAVHQIVCRMSEQPAAISARLRDRIYQTPTSLSAPAATTKEEPAATCETESNPDVVSSINDKASRKMGRQAIASAAQALSTLTQPFQSTAASSTTEIETDRNQTDVTGDLSTEEDSKPFAYGRWLALAIVLIFWLSVWFNFPKIQSSQWYQAIAAKWQNKSEASTDPAAQLALAGQQTDATAPATQLQSTASTTLPPALPPAFNQLPGAQTTGTQTTGSQSTPQIPAALQSPKQWNDSPNDIPAETSIANAIPSLPPAALDSSKVESEAESTTTAAAPPAALPTPQLPTRLTSEESVADHSPNNDAQTTPFNPPPAFVETEIATDVNDPSPAEAIAQDLPSEPEASGNRSNNTTFDLPPTLPAPDMNIAQRSSVDIGEAQPEDSTPTDNPVAQPLAVPTVANTDLTQPETSTAEPSVEAIAAASSAAEPQTQLTAAVRDLPPIAEQEDEGTQDKTQNAFTTEKDLVTDANVPNKPLTPLLPPTSTDTKISQPQTALQPSVSDLPSQPEMPKAQPLIPNNVAANRNENPPVNQSPEKVQGGLISEDPEVQKPNVPKQEDSAVQLLQQSAMVALDQKWSVVLPGGIGKIKAKGMTGNWHLYFSGVSKLSAHQIHNEPNIQVERCFVLLHSEVPNETLRLRTPKGDIFLTALKPNSEIVVEVRPYLPPGFTAAETQTRYVLGCLGVAGTFVVDHNQKEQALSKDDWLVVDTDGQARELHEPLPQEITESIAYLKNGKPLAHVSELAEMLNQPYGLTMLTDLAATDSGATDPAVINKRSLAGIWSYYLGRMEPIAHILNDPAMRNENDWNDHIDAVRDCLQSDPAALGQLQSALGDLWNDEQLAGRIVGYQAQTMKATTMGALVDDLSNPGLARRVLAIHALKQLWQKDFGYDPLGETDTFKESITQWRQLLEDSRSSRIGVSPAPGLVPSTQR